MTDRRFTIQTEPRGINLIKPTSANAATRDDSQTPLAGTVPSSAIAATTVPEHRLSQGFFRRLSISLGNSRKSSMFPSPNQPRPNTYRMEPDSEYCFRPYKLQAKILEVLIEEMKGQTYDGATVNDLVKDISRSVHQLMKNVQLPRYKIITQTVIGQKLGQLLRIASRGLWDPKTDNMLSVNYETSDMIAVVTVHAIYFE